VQILTGRDEVLEATGRTPYARFATAMAANITGLAYGSGALWVGDGPLGRLAHAFGPEPAVDALIATARDTGLLDASWLNMPRRPADRIQAGLVVREEWNFHWSTAPPPVTPGTDAVVPVDDAAAVNALLDAAMPDSMLRPGHRMARQWYGIWASDADGPDRLVACAVDRSAWPVDPAAPTVGVLGAVAVDPAYRRQGLGAAVSAALTDRLRAVHDLVTLGVVEGNDGAARVYQRLGYTGVAQITSLWIRTPVPGNTGD
jgi:ribosomal protein S18 acetylase RimI-like enzyme